MLIIIESSNFSKFSCLEYYEQISFHLVFSKLTELHFISMLNFRKYGRQILRKITHENHNQHTTMCPCIEFQSIWRTLDFRTKFTQLYEWQNIEKINIKIVIQCTPVRNFSQFENFKFWDEICLKKYDWQKIWKNKHNRNKHTAMYPCTKFQSCCRTSN